MRKILVIKTAEDRTFERDLTDEIEKAIKAGRVPIGAPANDLYYAQMCQAIACSGYTNPDLTNEGRYVHMAPAQLKSVSIEFRQPKDGK